MTTTAAVIGCGRRAPSFTEVCLQVPDVQIVGFADPREGAAAELAGRFGGEAFTDVAQMIARTRPEFVCLITRPSVRLAPIRLCAEGGVKAILSEKPMSTSWPEAVAIHRVAREAGMQLAFCHQRRLTARFVEARRLIDGGAIGKVERLEGFCSNLYDWGTHWFDMFGHLNGDVDAEWVLAQAERRSPKTVFDQPVDAAGVSVVRYANGVTGLLMTGQAATASTRVRAIGERGIITVIPDGGTPAVVVLDEDGARESEPAKVNDDRGGITIAVADVIACMRAGRTSALDSANALRATQLIFASYLSSLRGQRVDLPLDADDGSLTLQRLFGLDG